MRIILFYQSLLSDWSHGNAHFLRGYARELQERGHEVIVYEPTRDDAAGPEAAIAPFEEIDSGLMHVAYHPGTLDLGRVLAGADLAIVHELNERELIARIGDYRSHHATFRLLFHDTYHRSHTDPESLALCDLRHYDGVLAGGDAIREIYLERGWARQAWTWHEAADTRIFYPRARESLEGDLVWLGNWSEKERSAELREFFLEPVAATGVRARAYGSRFPERARRALDSAGIEYGGWLPYFRTPDVFARFCATVHIPRRPYIENLPGIPTIRLFEGLACGIPVISAPWEDRENLFNKDDFLVARDGRQMKEHLWTVLNEPDFATSLAQAGWRTIEERHTCAHRVDQLLQICDDALRLPAFRPALQAAR